MPNHVSSNLTVSGPYLDVLRFVDAVDKSEKDDGNTFDFNGVVPMPEELHGTSSPARIQTQAEIDALWAEYNQKKADGTLKKWELRDGKPFGIGITQEASDALIVKYGTNNWYDWALNNWGTKWGAYDSSEWTLEERTNGTGTATISYNTAWSPATPFFERASELFPTLTFETQYADEGGGFVCETVYANGEVVEDTDYGWNTTNGIRVREAVGYGPDPDAEDADAE
jgi:hypothetical protein